jgi:hypothetical protein
MFFRQFILALALCGSLASPLIATTERGDRLIIEAGGVQGIAGVAGPAGAPGLAGAAGAAGIAGIPGVPGAPGILDFSDFFALMPGDNTATIAVGAPIQFPQNGPTSGTITRQGGASFTTFILPTIGTYLVQFQASIAEGTMGMAAQLALSINGVVDPNTVVGRSTGTDQVIGKSLVTTSVPNTTIEVINDGSTTALTLTPIAGGTHSVSTHVLIIRIQ